jgi:transposase
MFHTKAKEPVKGKGFRTLFRECKIRVCENPRPFRTGSVLRHGLVSCETCSRLWNRDTNAASNIWKIAVRAIRGEARPRYLARARVSLSGATSATTQP